MSRRAELERRLGRLAEISNIMTAMKTMALIETQKYGRFMTHQQQLVDSIEVAAADFLSFHPDLTGSSRAPQAQDHDVVILIGSERGFCGDFNETIASVEASLPGKPRLMVVGRRLAGKLEQHPRRVHWLAGANVAEEVPAVLDALIEELHRLSADPTSWRRLSVLSHDATGAILLQTLLPLVSVAEHPFGFPPRLTIEPERFLSALVKHYLAAKLPALFYGSLMAENRRRLEHMETALSRMETRMDEITRSRNALRQEEITEQIEIILLSTEAMLV